MIHKYLIFTITLMISISSLSAQNGVSAKLIPVEVESADIIAPQFPGGEAGLYKFIESNTRYPYLLLKIDMEGDLDIKFNIDKNGVVQDVEITRGFDPVADDEVIRMVKAMPRWIPATDSGQPVKMEQKLTISFKADEDLKKRAKEQREKEPNDNFYIGSLIINETDLSGIDSGEVAPDVISQSDTLLNRSPQFPGGKDALEAYLKSNLKYPKRAIQMGIEGRVIFNILISEQGEISRIALFKGIFRDCNEEAFYLIKKMPKWVPGLKDGKPAPMEVMLPIPFVLPK
ncbi:energy transducer TonB [Dysgonomonas sp. GY75]|uniref:energy transducer TonB n=1 Tax=Dysgonomonas sp. GY75 TaxID=2780419 RepID=UPI001F54F99F|nr:energy transducer TonB [Dysgonomonas sp. GY75]